MQGDRATVFRGVKHSVVETGNPGAKQVLNVQGPQRLGRSFSSAALQGHKTVFTGKKSFVGTGFLGNANRPELNGTRNKPGLFGNTTFFGKPRLTAKQEPTFLVHLDM